MTDAAAARAFIAKWDQNAQKENSAAKERFVDLCRLLGVRTPNDPGSGPDTYSAYGWPYYLGDDEILARLLGLNLERAAGRSGAGRG